MNSQFDDYEEMDPLPDDEFFQDENQLKKNINKLRRELARWEKDGLKLLQAHEREIKEIYQHNDKALENTTKSYEAEIAHLRNQIRELYTKNLELHEASKIFVKGLEHLKQEHRIITTNHTYHIRDKDDLARKIDNLTKPTIFDQGPKYRVVATVITKFNSHSQAVEALVTTEHLEKIKR